MSIAAQGFATASGTVYDSVAKAPLAGAVVQLVAVGDSAAGATFTARTDSSGQFQFDSLPAGRFAAGFSHPAIDTMGFERSTVEVLVRRGLQQIRLGTPSPQTIFRMVCAGARQGGPPNLLFGHVLRASDGEPLFDASVLITRVGGTAIVGESVIRKDVTDGAVVGDKGAFAICEAPDNISLLIRAASGADTSGSIPVRLAANSIRHVTLSVGRARRVAVVRPPSADRPAPLSESVWRGPSRLRGIVSNPAGAPMAAVRVQVVGTGMETVTDARGAYALDSLPEGTQLLEARAIGYEPMRPVVHLAGEAPMVADVTMLYRAVTLDEVVVRGSFERNLELFEQRRRASASGHFLRPEEIALRPPAQTMAKLIDGIPQVIVRCRSSQLCVVTMFKGTSRQATDPGANARSESSREQCEPSLYVDGLLQRVADFNYLTAREIAAVEVYTRNFRPGEFTDLHNDCGSVVFWTRLRGPSRP